MRRTIGAGLALVGFLFLFSQTVVPQDLRPIIVRTRSGLLMGYHTRRCNSLALFSRSLEIESGLNLMQLVPEALRLLKLWRLDKRHSRESVINFNPDASIRRLSLGEHTCKGRFYGV